MVPPGAVKDDNYHTYDLGTVKLNYNTAVWITRDPGHAKDIIIDRTFLVKDKTPVPGKTSGK